MRKQIKLRMKHRKEIKRRWRLIGRFARWPEAESTKEREVQYNLQQQKRRQLGMP